MRKPPRRIATNELSIGFVDVIQNKFNIELYRFLSHLRSRSTFRHSRSRSRSLASFCLSRAFLESSQSFGIRALSQNSRIEGFIRLLFFSKIVTRTFGHSILGRLWCIDDRCPHKYHCRLWVQANVSMPIERTRGK
jgi:hypothetical protein